MQCWRWDVIWLVFRGGYWWLRSFLMEKTWKKKKWLKRLSRAYLTRRCAYIMLQSLGKACGEKSYSLVLIRELQNVGPLYKIRCIYGTLKIMVCTDHALIELVFILMSNIRQKSKSCVTIASNIETESCGRLLNHCVIWVNWPFRRSHWKLLKDRRSLMESPRNRFQPRQVSVTITAVILNACILVCPIHSRHSVNQFIYYLIIMWRTNLWRQNLHL